MRLGTLRTGVVVLAIAIGAVWMVASAGGLGAAPEYRCQMLRGTIVLDDATGVGTARGSFDGSVEIGWVGNDFSGPNIRTFYDLVVTPKRGEPFHLAMDLVANNYTSSALIGGGILTETPPEGSFSAINVRLGPTEDRPDGSPPDVYTYEGERCR
jgi:hypothetical protein